MFVCMCWGGGGERRKQDVTIYKNAKGMVHHNASIYAEWYLPMPGQQASRLGVPDHH